MKKRVNKRLTLHRETLLSLEAGGVRGAGATDTCNPEPMATGCGCETGAECLPHSACFGTCSCSYPPCS